MTQFDGEKEHIGSKIHANHNCKFFVNIFAFLSHFFNFHGSKVRGCVRTVVQLQFPYKVGKIREPQAQFEKRPIRAVSKPASTALAHYKFEI